MIYTPVSQCNGFFAWLWHNWDFRTGWDGPYCEIRTVGFRLFGWEWEWMERRENT